MTNKKLKHILKISAYTMPSIVMLTLFVIVPIVLSAVMGFFNVSAIDRPWKFVGGAYYKIAFRDPLFYQSLLNTILFGGLSVLINFVFGLFLSLILSNHKRLNFYRYVFYIPAVVSSVTMGILWGQILLPTEQGLLNTLVMAFGIKDPVNWLNRQNVKTVIVMINFIGAGGGMTLVLFTNAIRNIPGEIRESAVIEGASGIQIAARITVPMITSTLSAWIILNIIGGMKIFESIFALTGGGPGVDTYTLAIYVYESRRSVFGLGYTSALGVLMSIIIVVMTLLYTVFSRYNKDDGVEM